MGLLITTDIKLKSLCPRDIQGSYFSSRVFGLIQVISDANLMSVTIKTDHCELPFPVRMSDIYDAMLMVDT